jgi:hypothetical protein
MRKRLVSEEDGNGAKAAGLGGAWLDLETLAHAEISSEDPHFPIEDALGHLETEGWRAAVTGPQTIRILFEEPVAVRRILVKFVEKTTERSQEFALFAQTSEGGLREIRRQQFMFSPGGATEELEDFAVELNEVTGIQLKIDPDRAHDPRQSKSHATLTRLRLG